MFAPPPAPTFQLDKDARLWGMLAHLSALAGYIIPLGNFVGPLIVWMMKKQEYPFVDDQGKESLNFQITVLLALLLLSPTVCIGIGLIILPIVGVAALIFIIIAGIKANEGVAYRYPFALRLIK
ncbi:MAG: DUF4870 domain-containing protein [Anaerolineae bacterium]|nr:DUF4870 domain-containing protein [Phycisphaerae bacterium]